MRSRAFYANWWGSGFGNRLRLAPSGACSRLVTLQASHLQGPIGFGNRNGSSREPGQ